MAIYTLYIFDRHCKCLFFHNWQNNTSSIGTATELPPLPTDANDGANPSSIATTSKALPQAPAPPASAAAPAKHNKISWQEEAKLVYGVVISFRSIARKLSLKPSADGFVSYKTSAYRLHYFESPSLLKFVLTTDPKVETMRHVLRTIYLNLYVEYIVKNPLVKRDEMFHNETFQRELHRFIRSLPVFES